LISHLCFRIPIPKPYGRLLGPRNADGRFSSFKQGENSPPRVKIFRPIDTKPKGFIS
jgi:hypothetical protein